MKIANWNNQPKVEDAHLHTFPREVQDSICPRGAGRSYGDASLDTQMLDMSTHTPFFQLEGDILELSSGFTLAEILHRIVPLGYTMPVMPGTRHVTLGGMIAADVHGKNHTEKGSIGHWIEAIHLQLADGNTVSCTPEAHRELFRATIGGLGLTGLILGARVKLERISGTRWSQTAQHFATLDALIDGLITSKAEQKAAWFDARVEGRNFLLQHTLINGEEELSHFQLTPAKWRAPHLPFALVSPLAMRLYNARYARNLRKARTTAVSWDSCFFPLDRIADWNRLYGPRGFYQLQCVIPVHKAKASYALMLDHMRKAKCFPVLSVMKVHGAHPLPGILSYTHPGISVAFDFINTPGAAACIRALHTIIAEAGGRVYLVKDALLAREDFEKMYPEAEEFRKIVAVHNPGKYTSLLAKRLNLVPQ